MVHIIAGLSRLLPSIRTLTHRLSPRTAAMICEHMSRKDGRLGLPKHLVIRLLTVVAIGIVLVSVQSQTRKQSKPTPSRAKSLSAKEVAQRVLPAVVLLVCSNDKGEKSLASGFYVRTNNESGVVATNYHVIKGMDQGVVSAVLGGEKRIMAVSAVLNFDDINDLAVLRVQPVESPQTIRINNLSFATSTPSVGETIYALGNPEGLTGTFSQGIVSGIRSFDLGKR